MKKIVFVTLSSIGILIAGCNSNEQSENRLPNLNKALNSVLSKDNLMSSNYCVVVPRAGCGGCIDQALAYLKMKIDSLQDTQIILTGIEDKKLLKLDLGSDFLARANVHLDTANLFRYTETKSIYPQIIAIENGVAISFKDLDVTNLSIEKLNLQNR